MKGRSAQRLRLGGPESNIDTMNGLIVTTSELKDKQGGRCLQKQTIDL